MKFSRAVVLSSREVHFSSDVYKVYYTKSPRSAVENMHV